MIDSTRFGVTVAALALVSVATGCANPGASRAKSASIFGGKVDTRNIGLATRAQMALVKGDTAAAIDFAERAVQGSPRDAGFRALLGNIYLTAGRFASAESAYRDSLSLVADQPAIVLKLVLAEIALGKREAAVTLLNEARNAIDPADVGLALALAGQPADAVSLLDPIARQPGADARTRQNLALAHALAGDWQAARTIAAQDVPADQLEARIQQWMTFAAPARQTDQVASLIGVTPAADPGQPVRLALVAAPAEAPVVRTVVAEPVAAPVAAPARVVEVQLAPPTAAPAPVAIAVTNSPAPAVSVAVALPPAAPAAVAAPLPRRAAAAAPLRAASAVPQRLALRKAALVRPLGGSARSVVQLGAYGSAQRVAAAWTQSTRRFGSLRNYSPMSARFDSPRGTFYRLSVHGFASDREATGLCLSLRRAGANCFVRTQAGDRPVQFAAR